MPCAAVADRLTAQAEKAGHVESIVQGLREPWCVQEAGRQRVRPLELAAPSNSGQGRASWSGQERRQGFERGLVASRMMCNGLSKTPHYSQCGSRSAESSAHARPFSSFAPLLRFLLSHLDYMVRLAGTYTREIASSEPLPCCPSELRQQGNQGDAHEGVRRGDGRQVRAIPHPPAAYYQ